MSIAATGITNNSSLQTTDAPGQAKAASLPTNTGNTSLLETLTIIPRVITTILLDAIILPFALILLIAAKCKVNFNPAQHDIKKNKTPILLLHGSGFNESQWVLGRQFLKKDTYGSVFSINYAGLISNDPKKGIAEYATTEIADEVKRIKKETQSQDVIIIGHSMGGMIAGYYAEHVAKPDEIQHVMSIASPWQGTPTIDKSWRLGGKFSREHETKRHLQMSQYGGESNFREQLVTKALASEKANTRKYYNIWSTTDYAVPFDSGMLTKETSRQRVFNYLGHYSIVAWPSVWLQTRSWLDDIYKEK